MDIKEEQEFLLRVGDEKFTLPYREAIERVNKKLETSVVTVDVSNFYFSDT